MFAYVPLHTRPGDILAIFRGERAPQVLRRRGDELAGYTYLGEAYVNGIMDGEFLDTLPGQKEFHIY